MISSIERVWRKMSVQSLMPAIVVISVASSPTDPTRKNTAYGGVLPVPAPATPTTASASRSENLIDQQHREQRASRGRVLYATGRAPQQQPTVVRTEVKPPQCERRVVQGKTAPAPTS
jgi:hypothetical protein